MGILDKIRLTYRRFYNNHLHSEDYAKRKVILDFLNGSDDAEIREICEFFQTYRLTAFPYLWERDYKKTPIECSQDAEGYIYVNHHGRKLYGLKEWKKRHHIKRYRDLMVEQDKRSPHCYLLKPERFPKPGSVIADIGAAEGNFALDVVEDCKKLYLFECDDVWLEPLRRTFAPWGGKVEIVSKFVGAKNEGNTITLDEFFKDKEIDYIKADVEGAEADMLAGGETTFRTKVRQTLLCAYHRQEDEKMLAEQLTKFGYKYDINPGYMFFSLNPDDFKPPYLRRGVIYGERI